jgi:hypothetical protein
MFESELEKLRAFYSEMLLKQTISHPFEDRFQTLCLQYKIEDLLAGRRGENAGGYHYCFFANHRGIRYLLVDERRAELAVKIRSQLPLSLSEKADALKLLTELSA